MCVLVCEHDVRAHAHTNTHSLVLCGIDKSNIKSSSHAYVGACVCTGHVPLCVGGARAPVRVHVRTHTSTLPEANIKSPNRPHVTSVDQDG